MTSLPPPPRWATRQCGWRRAIRSLTWCVGGRARTYCRPFSRSSASPAGHTTLPWLAPRQHTPLSALDLATPAVAVDAQQASSVRARALVQHGGEVPDQAWDGAPRLVVLVLARSGVLAKVRGIRSGRRQLAPARMEGGAMCTLSGRGRLSRTVAVSLAREDCTRTPRWRARARIVLSRRSRRVPTRRLHRPGSRAHAPQRRPPSGCALRRTHLHLDYGSEN